MKSPLILREALPYLKKFCNKIFVIKAGGGVIDHIDFPQLTKDIATLVHLNIKVVFVFGAGPQFDKELLNRKIAFEKINGIRITTKEMMPIFKKVTLDDFKKIEALFKNEDVQITNITEFLSSKEIKIPNFKKKHFTGEILNVDNEGIFNVFKKGLLPVCFSIVDGKNCNADNVATLIAKKLQAEKLIFLTGTRGVYIEGNDKEPVLLTSATPEKLNFYIENGNIFGGMIPKVLSASKAVLSGIPKVHIISGLTDGTLLTEVFTEQGCGTMITKKVLPQEK